jgi:hypothetical protein
MVRYLLASTVPIPPAFTIQLHLHDAASACLPGHHMREQLTATLLLDVWFSQVFRRQC